MTASQRLANQWLLVNAVSSAVAIVATVAGEGTALTTVPLLWFLAVCPGLGYVHLLGMDDAMRRWTITIALSLALDALVAEALLYTHMYTALRVVVVLAVVACAGAVIARLKVRGKTDPAEAPVVPVEMSSS